MNQFLSCDWGTSSFRLKLVSIPDLNVLAEEKSGEGIAIIYNSWKEKNVNERLQFYLSVLENSLKVLQTKTDVPLVNTPIIISGMASSTIGILDLPYKQLPVHLDGSDFIVEKINLAENFSNDVFIISGLRTENDVMRGEETQLAGAANEKVEGLFIFPGTHSKHIQVKNGLAIDLKTYMTGEFFELLSTKSILANSVEKTNSITEKLMGVFKSGLEGSKENNLLHNSFLVRTKFLFRHYTKEENYYYLSGLVIGSELENIRSTNSKNILLVGARELTKLYSTALNLLQPQLQIKIIDGEVASIKGQYKIYQSFLLK